MHRRSQSVVYGQLGFIEMNPWHSRITSPENPDYCVIDLDPEKIPFEKVVETANIVKQVLDELDMDSYCKTSGSTGLHIYIPLGAKYSYDQSRQLAEFIVQFVHDEIPDFTSMERNPKRDKRKSIWIISEQDNTNPRRTLFFKAKRSSNSIDTSSLGRSEERTLAQRFYDR